MITRRKFLGASLIGGATFALSAQPFFSHASSFSEFAAPLLQPGADETLITILHTNDQHSQIDPLPANDRNAGKAGSHAAPRSSSAFAPKILTRCSWMPAIPFRARLISISTEAWSNTRR